MKDWRDRCRRIRKLALPRHRTGGVISGLKTWVYFRRMGRFPSSWRGRDFWGVIPERQFRSRFEWPTIWTDESLSVPDTNTSPGDGVPIRNLLELYVRDVHESGIRQFGHRGQVRQLSNPDDSSPPSGSASALAPSAGPLSRLGSVSCQPQLYDRSTPQCHI